VLASDGKTACYIATGTNDGFIITTTVAVDDVIRVTMPAVVVALCSE